MSTTNVPESKTAILGPPVSYVTILDATTEEKIKREAAAPPTYNPLRPSSAGKCTRELAYAYNEYLGNAKYVKPLISNEIDRVFKLGHSVEYHVLNLFKERAGDFFDIRYKQQVVGFFKIPDPSNEQLEKWIEGSIDMCFMSSSHGGLGDVKSKKEKFSKSHQSDWDEFNEKLANMQSVVPIGDDGKGWWIDDVEAFLEEVNDPFLAMNFWQVNGYLNTDFVKERGIDHGFLLQYSKNTSRMRELRFRPSPNLYRRLQEKFELASAAGRAGNPELAPRDFMLGSSKCAFCDYRNECWKDDSAGVDPLKAYFKTLPPKNWPTDTDRLGDRVAGKLDSLYSEYSKAQEKAEGVETLEKAIIKELLESGIRKVRFSDGKVYEVKHLKSPYPHVELRRSKA